MADVREGVCEFCGQAIMIPNEAYIEAKGDKRYAAKLACDCPEAKIFKNRHEKKAKAVEMVDAVAGKDSGEPLNDETVGMLHRAVQYMVDRKIGGITIQADGATKVVLSAGSKGIKCERTTKVKNGREMEI